MMTPHGGKLINKVLSASEKEKVIKKSNWLPKLVLNTEQIKDIRNIAYGVYSPLEGFLREEDFKEVISEMRLSNGIVWPIPIVLDISKDEFKRIKNKKIILLVSQKKKPVALLKNIQIYSYDKQSFAENVFQTLDRNHPGVEDIFKMKEFLVGGDIELLDTSCNYFSKYNLTPKETREIFQRRGWRTIVAFQTRNIPHRGHEFLQKHALENIDGLFIQPVTGEKKLGDFKDEYILASYELLIDKYYPKNKTLLGILPLKMRYAGPREALLHALIRQNFGCTHFIVGRDHAGVGNYYSPFAAQKIFDKFGQNEIGINILKYPEVIYCPTCKKHLFSTQCPHTEKISFSGSKLREAIKRKEEPPSYIIRREIYNLIAYSYNSLVDSLYKKPDPVEQKGFVLWFTGLSQAGKSTIADEVFKILKNRGKKVERLDGDIVRKSLTRDLGFSKEDRDENIRRVGIIAKLLSENGIGVIASFISPYRSQRRRLREKIENFIEVFCNAPLEVCEQRDTKGLYKKARRGEIRNFTGISDPYEEPENPEIELFTAKESIEENVNKIIYYLEEHNLI